MAPNNFRGHGGPRPAEKNDKFAESMKKVFVYMNRYLFWIIVALTLAAGGAVLTIIGPNRIGDITNYITDGIMTEIDMKGIAEVGTFLLTIYILGALFSFGQHFIMATVTLKTAKQLREDLSDKINKVPQKYFNTHSQGDVLSRITNDVQTLRQGMANSLPNIIGAVAQFIGCLIMMFKTEWHLSVCIIVVTIFGFILLIAIMGNSQKYFTARQESLGNLNGFIEEMYSGHEVVRLSRADRKVKEHFDGLNKKVYDANWKSQFLSGMMQPLMNVIGNLGYVAVCVVGSALAINGTIKFGVIISFIMYVRLFTSPLTQIAQGMTNLQTASASARRIFDFLESEEMPNESEFLDKVNDIRGDVSFEHVRFAYPDTPEKIIIKDFSAEVKSGQKVAIVGPTGAGKTTMVNLLMKFYDINDGRICIDGKPINEIPRDQVHGMFGMVLQDTWLFEGTVRENLVYNMEDITQEKLEQVTKACGIDRFIHSLPEGFDTVLSESTTISAGQKQLFTIARAMLQNCPMLILDEATSSVDTRTELIIQRAMDKLMENRTSFVIAHRLSTIKNADLILVMREGDVIESGNHEALMAQNGFYSELYNSQFEQA